MGSTIPRASQQSCEKHRVELIIAEHTGEEFCPKCVKEEADALAEELMAKVAKEEILNKERREQEKTQARFERCRIGRRFAAVKFDDYKPPTPEAEKVLHFCERYAATFEDRLAAGDSICMVGNYGTGKNMLSAAICNEVMNNGYTAIHSTAIKIVRRVKATWNNKEDEQTAIDEFALPDLLVIDEVGVQFGSATEKMFLTEVINERYEAQRPTIIISNLPAEALEVYLSERAIDRFYEGNSRVLVFNWESYRRRGGMK